MNCQNIHRNEQKWKIDKLALFLSDIQLETNAAKTPVLTDSNGTVALARVDPLSCTAKVTLLSHAPISQGSLFSFNMGVPFALNHLNPVTQPPPMNEPDMFWTWRNGYKFLRIDMQQVSQPDQQPDSWAYHLGSVGCVATSAVRSPSQACAKPNLSRFTVPVSQANGLTLQFHLDVLLQDIELTKKNRCAMHGDSEPACDILYRNISGPANISEPEGVSEQGRALFSLESR